MRVNFAAVTFLDLKWIQKVCFFVHFAGKKILIVTRPTEYIVPIVKIILKELNNGGATVKRVSFFTILMICIIVFAYSSFVQTEESGGQCGTEGDADNRK